jgi:DNA invertase Pin-like site-specific DNA recombinase
MKTKEVQTPKNAEPARWARYPTGLRKRLIDRWDFNPKGLVRWLPEIAQKGMPVVLYVRVSGWEQNRRLNLRDQKRQMRRELRKMGVRVIDVFKEVCSGYIAKLGPKAVRVRAARFANFHGAIVVAESVSRLLRSSDYSKENQNVRPGRREWEALLDWMFDVPLATLEQPEITPGQERSAQTRRGLLEKGATPGRPCARAPGYKKRRRERLFDRIRELRERGLSLREIHRKTGVPLSTFRAWLQDPGFVCGFSTPTEEKRPLIR